MFVVAGFKERVGNVAEAGFINQSAFGSGALEVEADS